MTKKIKIGIIIMFSMISMFSLLSSLHTIPVKAATTSKETTSSEIKNDKQESKTIIILNKDSQKERTNILGMSRKEPSTIIEKKVEYAGFVIALIGGVVLMIIGWICGR